MNDASFRAQLVARRTYCRPTQDGHESWEQVVNRVKMHQKWLWERALGRPLSLPEDTELDRLALLMHKRAALPSGRILWMGGTEQAQKTEIAMFNCCFLEIRDVYSAVDAFYLLLNGCGVGFKPVSGLLNGLATPVKVEVQRSTRDNKGNPANEEQHFVDRGGKKVWRLTIGDSGEAWAKALGKILAMKKPVDKIILDFSEIRPAGKALAGYGWLSSGDSKVAEAFEQIVLIMSRKAGQILDEIDILDIMNLAGTTLTSRRSAQIALMHSHHELAETFADAKRDHYQRGLPWRSQSNNSLVFFRRPNKLELRGLFQRMLDAGGSEPGLYNGTAARRRAPWFAGTNPCGEILLADGGLCNLCEVDLCKFSDLNELLLAVELIARANYRQTCVWLKDRVLSDRWHETQEFLRLCGVGLTGIARYQKKVSHEVFVQTLEECRHAARRGAVGMADELGLPRPKAITTVKPSGTLGKLMDTTEGLHMPLGRYIFNNIKFDSLDPVLGDLRAAGYRTFVDPYNDNNTIVTIPVDSGAEVPEVVVEPAVDQLYRYKTLMDHYVDHNASVTISYSPEEIPEIVDWLYENWDSYVGVSFILRTDPTKTAEDLGYPYLPQEVVTQADFLEYTESLSPVEILGGEMLDMDDCAGGACPIR